MKIKRTISAITLATLVSNSRKEYQHEYYMKRRQELNDRHKKYYQEHKEELKAYSKKRYRDKVCGG